jgi:NTP pyrophosphatase (non-canonical NTP hydrolase)
MTMDKKGLTKLIEECGELIQIAAKKSAFMDTDKHPDGKESMTQRLQEEIADVLGACEFVIQEFELDETFMEERARAKFKLFKKWHSEYQEVKS